MGLIYIFLVAIIAILIGILISPNKQNNISERHAGRNPQNKPLMVLCMRAYVPTMTAGAEITSHITNKYLQKAGWDVAVIVKHYKVSMHEGITIIPSMSKDPAIYDDTPEAASYLSRATCIGFQNIGFEDAFSIAKHYQKPAVFFIHATSAGKEFFNYTGGWPTFVVYNSWTMMGDISAPYKSYVVKPWVDIKRFSFIPTKPTYITLINLNESKGGPFLIELARRMPDCQFLGVHGGYGEQITDSTLPNLKYHPKTDNIEDVYNQTKILLVPSHLETWGRVAVEGMSAGIPVIVNDVPGLRECVGDAAIVARREDAAAWEEQIRHLLRSPSYYTEYSRRSSNRAKELDNDEDMRGLGNALQIALRV